MDARLTCSETHRGLLVIITELCGWRYSGCHSGLAAHYHSHVHFPSVGWVLPSGPHCSGFLSVPDEVKEPSPITASLHCDPWWITATKLLEDVSGTLTTELLTALEMDASTGLLQRTQSDGEFSGIKLSIFSYILTSLSLRTPSQGSQSTSRVYPSFSRGLHPIQGQRSQPSNVLDLAHVSCHEMKLQMVFNVSEFSSVLLCLPWSGTFRIHSSVPLGKYILTSSYGSLFLCLLLHTGSPGSPYNAMSVAL